MQVFASLSEITIHMFLLGISVEYISESCADMPMNYYVLPGLIRVVSHLLYIYIYIYIYIYYIYIFIYILCIYVLYIYLRCKIIGYICILQTFHVIGYMY